MKRLSISAQHILLAFISCVVFSANPLVASENEEALNILLEDVLAEHGFSGNIEATLSARLGRPLDPELADLGRFLFFDEALSLHNDNACAGCHTPAFGFGDPQSIAYGVSNNRIVGPGRRGTRNERKAPLLTNVAFFPKLMLNGRFEAVSGDPFDNSEGFKFPFPNENRFLPNDPEVPNLLTAQAFLPVPSLVEMSGFQGTAGTIGPRFDQFDDGIGTIIPPPDSTGTRQEPIRQLVLQRLNTNVDYTHLFEKLFGPGGITFERVGQALAEFQISLLAANAPIDQFARGERDAMTITQKRGALLFFGEAQCVQCHAVAGTANEMFSDFENHAIGVPQAGPEFGVGKSNIILDGPNEDEDFGRERISGDPADRYKFRTSPIRNAVVQPAFFHNGAFTSLEDAIRHHLDVFSSALNYDPVSAGVAPDLHNQGPLGPVLAQVDPLLIAPTHLSDDEFEDLVEFVRTGLLDPRALPAEMCNTIPFAVPSGMPLPVFEGCEKVNVCHRPPGNSSEKAITVTIDRSQAVNHLAHGDSVGSCELN